MGFAVDGCTGGVWNTDTNQALDDSPSWDMIELHKNNPRKLKVLMDKMTKVSGKEGAGMPKYLPQ